MCVRSSVVMVVSRAQCWPQSEAMRCKRLVIVREASIKVKSLVEASEKDCSVCGEKLDKELDNAKQEAAARQALFTCHAQ